MPLIPTAADHARYAWSALTGRPFHLPSIERLIDAELERSEHRASGDVGPGRDGSDAADPNGSTEEPWVPAVWRGFHLRRMRQLARRAFSADRAGGAAPGDCPRGRVVGG